MGVFCLFNEGCTNICHVCLGEGRVCACASTVNANSLIFLCIFSLLFFIFCSSPHLPASPLCLHSSSCFLYHYHHSYHHSWWVLCSPSVCVVYGVSAQVFTHHRFDIPLQLQSFPLAPPLLSLFPLCLCPHLLPPLPLPPLLVRSLLSQCMYMLCFSCPHSRHSLCFIFNDFAKLSPTFSYSTVPPTSEPTQSSTGPPASTNTLGKYPQPYIHTYSYVLHFSVCPKLDDVISRRYLAAIAWNHITHWEPLGPFLDLTRQQKVEIAQKYRGNYGLQKRECLEVWKEVTGDGATYRALISAAEEAQDKQLADNIRNIIQQESSKIEQFYYCDCLVGEKVLHVPTRLGSLYPHISNKTKKHLTVHNPCCSLCFEPYRKKMTMYIMCEKLSINCRFNRLNGLWKGHN